MKGTGPRGRWLAEDRILAERLKASPKERAENLMIVDLLRNDLGRIAMTGSVKVDSIFDIETYPTVQQMTSTVSARVRDEVSLTDVLGALFPCGSITGAPKRRSMAIIGELEERPRGVYCGAIGCLAPGGEALFSVAIRTLLLDRASGRISMGVGSGITYDSRPEAEYAESIAKAAFLSAGMDDFHLFETLRLDSGGYARLERHLERLADSAAYFGFNFDRIEAVRLLEKLVPPSEEPLRVKLMLSSSGCLTITSGPIVAEPSPLVVGLASTRFDPANRLLYHKTSCRDLYGAEKEKRPDCSELLFLNSRGELAEGSYNNIVLRLAGRLVTPPMESGLLPGVMRAELIAQGEVVEQTVYPQDLLAADEILLVNSRRGIRRAVIAEGEKI
jgi:para-aminobenzoate synthetase/4-amino-4-deoxychorismate lyase